MTRSATAAVLLVGTLLAVAGAVVSAWDVRDDVTSRLEERADRVTAVIALQLEQYGSASRAIAALRAGEPSQDEWVDLVDRLGIARDLASVYSAAAATLTDTGSERTLVIDRVAPLEPNRAALGLDVLSVPDAAPAALRALDEQVVSLSDALRLVQEPDDQAGLVVYAPWYRADGSVGGVTDLVLRGQDFLDALVAEIGELGVRVVDTGPNGSREIGQLVPDAGVDGDLTVTRMVEPFGQRWRVEVAAPAGFTSSTELVAPWLTLFGLLAVTALVASLVHVLRRREEHARGQVDERTAELVAANRDLEKAVAAKDEFLAVVTHEFRTPITVIRGFAETAAAGRAGELPDETRQWLGRIDQQAHRLHGLVDNLLTTAQLQTGELSVRTEVLDVARLVTAVIEQHAQVTPVDMELESPLMAEADPGHVVRVFDALLSNAGKYGRPPVAVTGRRAGDEVVVTVHDSGDGVPEGIAARIFTPFEQADRGDMRRSRGVGLGLAVVHELCERMGGSVRLVEIGRGACFEVRLPAGPEVASAAAATDED